MTNLDVRIATLKARLDELKAKQHTKERAARQIERQATRKAENQRKFHLGGLFKVADVFDIDAGALLGALLHAQPLLNDPLKFAEFKRVGDALLAQRERERKRATTADDYLQ